MLSFNSRPVLFRECICEYQMQAEVPSGQDKLKNKHFEQRVNRFCFE
jgi:hypothetical protein